MSKNFSAPSSNAKPGLGDHDVGVGERHARRGDRVGAVRDVRERPAVHERRHALDGLHQVRLEGVAQQRRHGADRARDRRRAPACRRGGSRRRCAPSRSFRSGDAVGEAQDRHDLARRGDVEAGLARHALAAAAEPDDDVAQRAVVHVEHAPPSTRRESRPSGVAVVQVVVDASRRAGCARSRRRGCRR